MSQMRTKKVVIAAAGTGGHVFPALAVARALQSVGVHIDWIGSASKIEAKIVREFPVTVLVAKGMRGKSFFSQIKHLFQMFYAFFQALHLMLRLRPHLVFCFGGFVSVPVGLAAWLCRCPLVIHEQNAVAGYANRLLAFFAKRIFTAFPGVFASYKKMQRVGNPVRAAILGVQHYAKRAPARTGPLRLLILGGSLGALAINEAVVAWYHMYSAPHSCSIWHQTGESDFDRVRLLYGASLDHPSIRVDAFIEAIDQAYEWADVVIGRAGALTVSELSWVGVPAILIPYPHAVDDHQTQNARYLQDSGAAIIIPQPEWNADTLERCLAKNFGQPSMLLAMSQSSPQSLQGHATDDMVQFCLQEI